MTRRGITELGRYDRRGRARTFRPRVRRQFRIIADSKAIRPTIFPAFRASAKRPRSSSSKRRARSTRCSRDPSLAGTPKLENLIDEYGEQRATLPRRLDRACAISTWNSIGNTAAVRAAGERRALPSLCDLEFKTLLAKLDVPVDMPLFANDETLKGNWRSYVASVDPPDYARLAAEFREMGTARKLAIALRGGGEIGSQRARPARDRFSSSVAGSRRSPRSALLAARVAATVVAYDTKGVAHGTGSRRGLTARSIR